MNEFLDFLWHTTFTLLWCFIFLSITAYRAGRDKVFLYYAAYDFFLLLYVGSRAGYLFSYEEISETAQTVRRLFNWHIQVIYHFVHMFFGIIIVGIDIKYPRLFKLLKKYAIISLTLGTLIPVLVLIGLLNPHHYDIYFVYIHIPVFMGVAVIILQKAWKEKDFVVSCFFWGTLIYAALAAIALFLTVLYRYGIVPPVHPMMLFYIGVIAETIAFAIGLGYRLQKVYLEKLQYQKDLNETQIKLQEKLEQKIKMKEQENVELIRSKEKQVLETQLAQLQNKILRSQMNSHFIFNVLNSIKTFIIENKERDAVNYLNKFSKFIRKILDSNFYEINTIEDEINTLKLYLEIESMRLHHNFVYSILVDKKINTKAVKFPSLLLQPYVENAIWHGLMPQKEEKELSICLKSTDGGIRIIIEDNGIGYNESLKNKPKPTSHKSFGINIVNQRIEEFNQRNKEKISTTLQDKSDHNGKGTIVEIYLQLHTSAQ